MPRGAMYVSYWVKQALCLEPWGPRQNLCYNVFRKAEAAHQWIAKDTEPPIPGDVFIMLYRNADGSLTFRGHTGFVLRVSEDGKSFNSCEGNCGNAVKVGLRHVRQSSLAGFVRFLPVPSQVWEKGILSPSVASSVGGDSTI